MVKRKYGTRLSWKFWEGLYFPISTKYTVSLLFATLWAVGSIYLARAWANDLNDLLGFDLGWIIIFGIAIIPGFMNGFAAMSLILDIRPSRKKHFTKYPDVTILVAAYNEEAAIASTIASIARQRYPGNMRTIVCNDGSQDGTSKIVRNLMKRYEWLGILDIYPNAGKANALNQGLSATTSNLVITVDGDTYLYKDALINIVERYMSDPPNTRAVAGAILVRNHDASICTKMQTFDYYIGIAGVKKLQSLYQGTLVAQGAFSLYDVETVRSVGGWPHTVGEDIVLTWGILRKGFRIGYAEDAIVFTNAPETWGQFIHQRIRWSRGLVEAFKEHWPMLFQLRLTTLFIWWNLLFPYLDLVYTFAFVPGIILAFFGIYWIAGPMTLALVPIALLMNWLSYKKQSIIVEGMGIKVRENKLYFLWYALFYSIILQPACVFGYIKEAVAGGVKNWGTK